MNKTYHPKSWSQQARELANRYYSGYENKEEAMKDLKNSYRATIIVQRAIKSFKRKIK